MYLCMLVASAVPWENIIILCGRSLKHVIELYFKTIKLHYTNCLMLLCKLNVKHHTVTGQ